MLELGDEPSLLRNMPLEEITSKDVYDAAIAGDSVARRVFDYTGRVLGGILRSELKDTDAAVLGASALGWEADKKF